MKPHECPHCRCYESPRPVPVIAGDRIHNRLTGEIGIVESVQAPNPPWHYGGVPYVSAGDGSGYWHYYDVIPPVAIGQRIRRLSTGEAAVVEVIERDDPWSPHVINAAGCVDVWHDYVLTEDA